MRTKGATATARTLERPIVQGLKGPTVGRQIRKRYQALPASDKQSLIMQARREWWEKLEDRLEERLPEHVFVNGDPVFQVSEDEGVTTQAESLPVPVPSEAAQAEGVVEGSAMDGAAGGRTAT